MITTNQAVGAGGDPLRIVPGAPSTQKSLTPWVELFCLAGVSGQFNAGTPDRPVRPIAQHFEPSRAAAKPRAGGPAKTHHD